MEGAKGFMFFICDIELTESGLGKNNNVEVDENFNTCFLIQVSYSLFTDHVDDIIASFFQYTKMLREIGPKDWIFKEVQVSVADCAIH